MIDSIDVLLWGNKVGTLVSTKSGYKNQVCFYFDKDFVRGGIDIAPLRVPIYGPVAQNGLPVYPEVDKRFGGLPSFISDSLPDYWGNTVFNEWAKSNKIRLKDITVLDRLSYIGIRGMGALEYMPSSNKNAEDPFKVKIERLSEFAQNALKQAKDFHIEFTPDLAIESLFTVGTSAGGRRPKAVINYNSATGECYSGQVPSPDPGYIPMIIKFDEHGDVPTTRIEYSYYLMALHSGLNMKNSFLLEQENSAHFLTERFDRDKDGNKNHVQSLAAMSPFSSSYEDLFTVAKRLKISPAEIKELFLLMTMNVLAANVDDHNKNFSFIMNQNGEWHVSPAYDFTFSVDPSAPYYMNGHSMMVNGKNHDITREDLLTIASEFNIKGASGIIEQAINSVKIYEQFASKAGVPDKWISFIGTEISNRLSHF